MQTRPENTKVFTICPYRDSVPNQEMNLIKKRNRSVIKNFMKAISTQSLDV
jgi:hypothetical protein